MTIKERNTIIRSAKKIECPNCEKGIYYCKTRPCWGTVNDFKKIIEAGHAKELMIDYYSHKNINNGNKIYFLSGSSNSNQCSKADWNPKGVCIFLENDKCRINDIKPTTGAVACCKKKPNISIMHACILTWNTKKGKQLIKDWKKMVDYKDKEDDEGFSFIDAYMAMAMGF
jgi:hypothetical protein